MARSEKQNVGTTSILKTRLLNLLIQLWTICTAIWTKIFSTKSIVAFEKDEKKEDRKATDAKNDSKDPSVSFPGWKRPILPKHSSTGSFPTHQQNRRTSNFDKDWEIKRDDLIDLQKIPSYASGLCLSQMAAAHEDRLEIVTIRASGKQAKRRTIKPTNLQEDGTKLRVLNEIITMRCIDLKNVNPFLGVCVDGNRPFVLYEYCSRESLRKILWNLEIRMPWSIRLEMAFDIANGLNCLHEEKIVHGHLTSLNCVIDRELVCKITDYGPDALLYPDGDKVQQFKAYPENRPYIPFEAFENDFAKPEPSWDVFAFGTLLIELARLKDPNEGKVPPSYNDKPTWGPQYPNELEFKQTFNNEEYVPDFRKYINRIDACRHVTPTLRPKAKTILDQLRIEIQSNNVSRYGGAIDYMDRCHNVVRDKNMTIFRIFYQTFPREIARRLLRGESPEPEQFDSVSVLFSDVVGYTSITRDAAPRDVMNFLNKMYSTFDEIKENFDVFKVETAGDAYMAVSGLPTRNGKSHAAQCTLFALEMLQACNNFVILHRPDVPLRIRVGISSGSVVAGVLGIVNRRYNVAGETVVLASRMESHGKADRIHISEATKDLLMDNGGFDIEERGFTDIKGFGQTKTFWVNSRKKPISFFALDRAPAKMRLNSAILEESSHYSNPAGNIDMEEEVPSAKFYIMDEDNIDDV